jgi:tRNA(adenine34) deaminase
MSGAPALDDMALMHAALEQARLAAARGEVPIGAVVAIDGRIVAAAHNRTLLDGDPTAHAEIVALREAARAVGNHRLVGATLVTTLEPCLMCCGALVQARIARLAWAADDAKAGALAVLRSEMARRRVNHVIELSPGAGPLTGESSTLLRDFFRARRPDVGPGQGRAPS